MLSDVVRCCQMFSDVVRCCQMLSDVVRCCQMLSDVVRCCQMLSVHNPIPNWILVNKIHGKAQVLPFDHHVARPVGVCGLTMSNLVGARRYPHSLSIGYRLLYHEITQPGRFKTPS